MLKWIRKNIEARRERKRLNAKLIAKQLELQRQAKLKETSKLLGISNCNVIHLNSSIKVLRGIASYAKGDNAMETRQKRANLRKQIEWLENKLPEANFEVTHYSSLLNTL